MGEAEHDIERAERVNLTRQPVERALEAVITTQSCGVTATSAAVAIAMAVRGVRLVVPPLIVGTAVVEEETNDVRDGTGSGPRRVDVQKVR